MSGTDGQGCNSEGLIPPHINQIYDELFVIHQKLQVGTGIISKVLLSNVMKILTFDRKFRSYLYTKSQLYAKTLLSSATSLKLIH